MEFTYSELLDAYQVLPKLGKLPVTTSLEFMLLSEKLQSPVMACIRTRDKLTRQYEIEFIQPPDGGLVASSKKDGNAQKYGEALNELMELKINIEIAGGIKLPRTYKIEPFVLLALRKFVEVTPASLPSSKVKTKGDEKIA